MLGDRDLTLQVGVTDNAGTRVAIVGEILWDVFGDAVWLGGAPLNFAVHASRLGLHPIVVSAVGNDALGDRAANQIAGLGLDGAMVRRSAKWPTGIASVVVDAAGQPAFQIVRPAAYDDFSLTEDELENLARLRPSWLYFGTLFPSTPEGRATLQSLLDALPDTARFYDVNLRDGFDAPDLVADLLARATVVKLNESEARRVGRDLGLPEELEAFCRCAAARFGWRAVCVTLGADGCALFDGVEFVRAPGETVTVADTVGAGDAFAAAFVHGLTLGWPAERIARFANRVGALVASRAGAIPEWSILETAMA